MINDQSKSILLLVSIFSLVSLAAGVFLTSSVAVTIIVSLTILTWCGFNYIDDAYLREGK